MARKPTGRPAGRPKKPTGPATLYKMQQGNQHQVVDWKKVDQYLEAGANGFQIAAKLEMHHDTLYNCCQRDHNVLWTEYAQSKKLGGDADLHWAQMASARRGNTQLLLKLGELRLGQAQVEEKTPPFQELLEIRHELMLLKAENEKLKDKLNGNQPEAKQELCGSDTPL